MKYLLSLLVASLLFSCNSNSSKSSEETTDSTSVMTEVATNADSSYVFFKSPQDGATVSSPVFVEMGVSGMQVEPAGEVHYGFGHHHILINQTVWPEGTVIPMSDSTKHYGKGQTDTTLDLPAGEYTLTLQFADGTHTSYGAAMATSIKVIVE